MLPTAISHSIAPYRLVVLFSSKLTSVSLTPLNQYPTSELACSEQQLQLCEIYCNTEGHVSRNS
jgi:hypothetical protein